MDFPVDHLSFSNISLYQRCPLAWKYRYVEGRESQQSAAMAVGTIAHKALAAIARQIISGKTTWSIDDIGRIAQGEADVFLPVSGLDEDGMEEAQSKLDVLTRYVIPEIYLKWLPELLSSAILAVEHTVRREHDGFLPFVGIIDLLLVGQDNVPVIVDYKTTSTNVKEIKHAHATQLAAYAWAMNTPAIGKIVYLKLGKRSGGVMLPRTIYVSQRQIDMFEKTIWDTGRAIRFSVENKVFTPTSIPDQVCAWCSYRDSCEYYGRLK